MVVTHQNLHLLTIIRSTICVTAIAGVDKVVTTFLHRLFAYLILRLLVTWARNWRYNDRCIRSRIRFKWGWSQRKIFSNRRRRQNLNLYVPHPTDTYVIPHHLFKNTIWVMCKHLFFFNMWKMYTWTLKSCSSFCCIWSTIPVSLIVNERTDWRQRTFIPTTRFSSIL